MAGEVCLLGRQISLVTTSSLLSIRYTRFENDDMTNIFDGKLNVCGIQKHQLKAGLVHADLKPANVLWSQEEVSLII